MKKNLRKYYYRTIISILVIFSVLSLFIISLDFFNKPYNINQILLFSLFSLILGSLYTHKINKSTILIESEEIPEVKVTKGKYKFTLGSAYITLEQQPRLCYTILDDAIKNKWDPLVLTRNPKDYKKTIWISDVEQKNSINPEDLEEIYYNYNNFITSKKGRIILLDSVEYLVTHNKFERTLHFLQDLKDDASFTNNILLISINPKSFEKEQLNLILSEFEEWNQ